MRATARAGAALLLAASLALAGCGRKVNAGGYATDTRNAIRIVGSPLAFPISAGVAERFARTHPDYRAPVVESTGTARGIALFCGGVGLRFPDIVVTDRRLTAAEAQRCLRDGVDAVAEIGIGRAAAGHDGAARLLFLYVKRQHLRLIDGLRPLLAGYAAGDGAQSSSAARARAAAAIAALAPIDLGAVR